MPFLPPLSLSFRRWQEGIFCFLVLVGFNASRRASPSFALISTPAGGHLLRLLFPSRFDASRRASPSFASISTQAGWGDHSPAPILLSFDASRRASPPASSFPLVSTPAGGNPPPASSFSSVSMPTGGHPPHLPRFRHGQGGHSPAPQFRRQEGIPLIRLDFDTGGRASPPASSFPLVSMPAGGDPPPASSFSSVSMPAGGHPPHLPRFRYRSLSCFRSPQFRRQEGIPLLPPLSLSFQRR